MLYLADVIVSRHATERYIQRFQPELRDLNNAELCGVIKSRILKSRKPTETEKCVIDNHCGQQSQKMLIDNDLCLIMTLGNHNGRKCWIVKTVFDISWLYREAGVLS